MPKISIIVLLFLGVGVSVMALMQAQHAVKEDEDSLTTNPEVSLQSIETSNQFDQLISAPEKLELHNQYYVLNARLYRSYQIPGLFNKDSLGPMIVSVEIAPVDSFQDVLSSSIDVDRVWLFSDVGSWSGQLLNGPVTGKLS